MNSQIFLPPFNFEYLNLNKKKILNNLKSLNSKEIKIKFLGGYTLSNFNEWLEIFTNINGINIKSELSDWGGGYENCINYLNNKSKFDVYIIFNSLNDFEDIDQNISPSNIKRIIDTIERFIFSRPNSKIIINLFNHQFYSELNDYDLKYDKFLSAINLSLIDLKNKYKNLILIDEKHNFDKHELSLSLDLRDWFFYGTGTNIEQTILQAYNYSIAINSIFKTTKKLLILDLDNTIWGGVIGDNSLNEIKINYEDPEGRIFLHFQKYIKGIKQKGILLAICSKNDESIVKKAFDKLNMPLNYDDFVITKINWKNKYLNIIEISKDLNLGLDSFVFVDDSPSERDEVKNFLPEVSVPNIGNDPSKYANIIDICQFFKSYLPPTNEDMGRHKSYKILLNEKKLKSKYLNQKEFLKSLSIKININLLNDENISRVQQLINKTNQFNLTTKRVTSEFLIKDLKKKWKFVISSKDIYGQHGIISFIYGKVYQSKIIIENWVMSCRVFNKHIENAIIYFISKSIKSSYQINNLEAKYIPSDRNMLLKDVMSNIGFKMKKNSRGDCIFDISPKDIYYDNELIEINDD